MVSSLFGSLVKLMLLSLALLLYKLSFIDVSPRPAIGYKLSHNQNNQQTSHHFPYAIQIYRDAEGIPRIYGKSHKDLLFGIGYAEAQDRLWTLFTRRLLIEGSLTKVFGKDALQADLYMRNLGLKSMGKENLRAMSEDKQTNQLLQAYVDGINSYAYGVKMLPFEFYLTGAKWQKWKKEDCLTIVLFFSHLLEFNWMYELARQRLLGLAGFDIARKVLGVGSDTNFRLNTILQESEVRQSGKWKDYNSTEGIEIMKKHWVEKAIKRMKQGSSFRIPPMFATAAGNAGGSNSWIVGGQHTKTGMPILANDPHLGSLIPSLFYPVELVLLNKSTNAIQFRIFGTTTNGMPNMPVGINDELAWGSTASYIDNKDIFVEQIRELDADGIQVKINVEEMDSAIMDANQTPRKLQYFFKGQWVDFTVRKQEITIKGYSEPVIKYYYHNHRGVILEQVLLSLHSKYGYPLSNPLRNYCLVFSSSIYHADATSAKGLLNLPFSTTIETILINGNDMNAPNIDITFILKNGTFGFRSLGRIPMRTIPQMSGFIKDGTVDLYDLGEYIDKMQAPMIVSPARGYLALANNKFAPDGYHDRSSLSEITTGRSYRINKLLSQGIKNGTKFSLEDMAQMQLDDRDQFLSQAFPGILKALKSVQSDWNSPKLAQIYRRLSKWDYYMPAHSVQAALYHVLERQFTRYLFLDLDMTYEEREALVNHAFFQSYLFKLYVNLGANVLGQEERVICSSSQVLELFPTRHPCLGALILSFKRLPQILQDLYPMFSSIDDYQWGKIHKQHFKNIPFSDAGLDFIWGRSYPGSGNSRTINVAVLSHGNNGARKPGTKADYTSSKVGKAHTDPPKNYYHPHSRHFYDSLGNPTFRLVSDMNRTLYMYDTGPSDRIFSRFYDIFVGRRDFIEYRKVDARKGIKGWFKAV